MVAGAIAVGLGFAGLHFGRPAAEQPEPFQGVVEFEERVQSFEVGGHITSLPVQRGDVVAEGALLAALDDSLERATRSARAGEASAAEAQLALLQAGARSEDVKSLAARVRAAAATEQLMRDNYAREKELFERNSVPRAALDDIQAQLERATAERQALAQNLAALRSGARDEEVASAKARALTARSTVDLEELRLSRHELRASHAGTVLDVHVEAGEVVNTGAPIATIADTTRPYVDVFVPQGKIGQVRLGAPVSVRIDALSRAFAGKVEHIARRTEFTPRYLFSERERPNLVVRVRVRVADPEQRLYAGVPAFVSLREKP